MLLLSVVAIAASIGLFFAASIPDEAPPFTDRYGYLSIVAAYWSTMIAYFAAVLYELAGALRRHRLDAPRRALRVGLRIVGIAVWAGVIYLALKIFELVLAHANRGAPLLRTVTSLDQYVLATGMVLLAVGPLLPALETAWTAAAKHVSDRCALLRLRGLWSKLTATMPSVVLGRRPSIWADLFGADASLRLYRRAIEVRDVLLAFDSNGVPMPLREHLDRTEPVRDVQAPSDIRVELDALLDLARVWPPKPSIERTVAST